MTRKDRVTAAIQHRDTDAVPYNIELVSELQARVEERLHIPAGSFSDQIGNCVQKADPDTGSYKAPGFYTDEYGVIWNRLVDKDIGNIENILITEPTFDRYEMPQADLNALKTRMEKLLDNGKDVFKVFKIGSVLFERSWFLRGFENLMTDFYDEPAFAHELMERLTQRQMPAIELGMAMGADGLYLGDDYGCQMGLIMSPATWRTFVKPYLKRLMEPALKLDKPVFLHSCGNITEILPDLIDMGLSVYQTVQPEVYDLGKLKKEYGRHLCFFGGIGTQSTLPHGTPAEVKQTVLETCRILGENGGYICGPTHKATADTPVDNVLAMVEALQGI